MHKRGDRKIIPMQQESEKERLALLQEFLTELLSIRANEALVTDLVTRLRGLHTPQSEIETCLLTRLTLHEAMSCVQDIQFWTATGRDQWIEMCERLGVPRQNCMLAVAAAQRFGGQIKKYPGDASEQERVIFELLLQANVSGDE